MEGQSNTSIELDNQLGNNNTEKIHKENEKHHWLECFEVNETLKFERFIEISKYFSSPLKKTASYACEKSIVSYPKELRLEHRRGVPSTNSIKFSNLTLEPVYIKYYNVYPEVENLKFQNLSRSRCRRIPPGLTFYLNVVYNNINDVISIRSKMVFVASRKTTTPCYQVCAIDLEIVAAKISRVPIN